MHAHSIMRMYAYVCYAWSHSVSVRRGVRLSTRDNLPFLELPLIDSLVTRMFVLLSTRSSMFLVRHTMQNLVRHTMTTVETMIIQISLSRSLPQNQFKINQQDSNIYPYFHDGIGIYVLPRSW
jgi:hypothetical protein